MSRDPHLSFRVPLGMKRRLDAAISRSRDPYAPTQTAILRRGLELALAELDKKRTK